MESSSNSEHKLEVVATKTIAVCTNQAPYTMIVVLEGTRGVVDVSSSRMAEDSWTRPIGRTPHIGVRWSFALSLYSDGERKPGELHSDVLTRYVHPDAIKLVTT